MSKFSSCAMVPNDLETGPLYACFVCVSRACGALTRVVVGAVCFVDGYERASALGCGLRLA